MDHLAWPALVQSHLERLEHELGAQVRRHRPAHDLAAPRVDDHRQIQEPAPRRHVGDVRDPEPIRSPGREHALDEIRRRPRVAIAHRRCRKAPSAYAGEACRVHQPRDPLARDRDAARAQLRVDARHAVGPARGLVRRADLPKQALIALRPRRCRRFGLPRARGL
jgi:hypothetical protein